MQELKDRARYSNERCQIYVLDHTMVSPIYLHTYVFRQYDTDSVSFSIELFITHCCSSSRNKYDVE